MKFTKEQAEKLLVAYEEHVDLCAWRGLGVNKVACLAWALDEVFGAAPAAEADPLTPDERKAVEYMRAVTPQSLLLGIIDRLAPRPAPAAKTPGQAAYEAHNAGSRARWELARQDHWEAIAKAVLEAAGK